jgi:hypothetical protein
MTWVSLRLQRTEMLLVAAAVALLAAALLPSGLDMGSAFHHDGLAACLGANPSPACGDAIHSFTSRFESLRNALGWMTLLPGLIGVTLAAPTILELEHGTHGLAWTQSITRRRWIATKLLTAAIAAVLAAGALTLFLTWWHRPFDRLTGPLETSSFDSEGTVAVAYALFALGLALAIGVVWRRVVPAVVIGFGVYMGSRVFVDVWLRQRFATPLSATWPRSRPGPDLSRAWVLNQYPSDRLGHRISPHVLGPGSCASKFDPNCVVKLIGNYTHAVYQPASRFWLFQGIETALFGGVALALLAFAAWWIHERAS